MGYTQKLGLLAQSVFQDSSLNVGIGAAPSGSYKLEVTGTAKVSSTLLVSGAATFSSTITASGNLNLQAGAVRNINFYDSSNTNINAQIQYDQISATSGQLFFGTNNAGTFATRLTISNTGAATFSSVVGANIAPLANYGLTTKGLYGIWIQRNSVNDSGIEIYHDGTNSIINTSYQSTGSYGGTLIYNGGSPRIAIQSGGNVGIGTTSPGEKFTVQTTANNWTGNFIGNSTSGQSLGLLVTAGTTATDSAFYIQSQNGSSLYLKIRGDGYLFSPPTYNNQWAGYSANMYVAGDGSFGRTTPSSVRYKDNIQDWNGKGLQTILALKPKTFNYKKDYCETANINFLGLIAEEVAEVLPYLAQYENPDRTGLVENVRYDTIVVPLIAAIQELNERLNKAGL